MSITKNIPPSEPKDIDYFVAQFPGGGQRGYATALLLKFFEETTGLPTHQLFPNVIASSVGIIITAGLYTPHKDKKAALMSSAQLCDIFPSITKRLPNTVAKFWNNNDWDVIGNAIGLIIGDVKLKDMLGSVQFTSHKLGGVKNSGIIFGKIINPETGEIKYAGDENTPLMDIIRMGTALPSIYKHHEGHIDIAFADSCATQIRKLTKILKGQGAFIRMGNFRTCDDPYVSRLKKSTLKDVIFGAIPDAISDDTYSRTISFAEEEFGKNSVFDLENIFSALDKDAPAVLANITTDEQFRRIEAYTQKYIEENKDKFISIANTAKKIALTRMNLHPQTYFGIEQKIQEFPLPEIPTFSRETNLSKTFNMSGSVIIKASQLFVSAARLSARMAFQAATSEPVTELLNQARGLIENYLQKIWNNCLPSLQTIPKAQPPREVSTPPQPDLD